MKQQKGLFFFSCRIFHQMGARVWPSYVFSYFGRFTRTRNDSWFNNNNRSGDGGEGDAREPLGSKTKQNKLSISRVEKTKRSVGIFLLFSFFAFFLLWHIASSWSCFVCSLTPFYSSFVFYSTLLYSTFTTCARMHKHKLNCTERIMKEKTRTMSLVLLLLLSVQLAFLL